MSRYELIIPGNPQTWIRAGGRGARYKPTKMRKYQNRVEQYAFGMGIGRNEKPTLTKKPLQPVRMVADLFYDDNRWRDLDNGTKTIADALQGLAYEDDAQIFEMILRKHRGQSQGRAAVAVEEMILHGHPSQMAGRNRRLSEAAAMLDSNGYGDVANVVRNAMIQMEM